LFSGFKFLGHSYLKPRTMRERLQPQAYISLTFPRGLLVADFGGPPMSARHRRHAGLNRSNAPLAAPAPGLSAAFHGPAGISIAPARVTAAALIIPLPCG
jgi:hypothetical protein